jgi:L-ascorbate metabolism protein UlaG (beta-lactamase superfamily)
VDGVTWLGHSTLVVELDGTRFLTDPVLGRRQAHLVRRRAVPRDALGRIDAVLVSHIHLDHLDLASLRRVERSVPVVLPRGAGGMVRRRRFRRVLEVVEGDELEFGPVAVTVTRADHGVVRRLLRARSSALGFVLRGSRSVYFAGDTDLFDGMRDLGPIDVALLPISGWGPRVPAGHLDPERAAEALRLVQPKLVVPVHWGTFRTPRAPEPGRDAADAFVEAAGRVAPEVEVRVLEIGETLPF